MASLLMNFYSEPSAVSSSEEEKVARSDDEPGREDVHWICGISILNWTSTTFSDNQDPRHCGIAHAHIVRSHHSRFSALAYV